MPRGFLHRGNLAGNRDAGFKLRFQPLGNWTTITRMLERLGPNINESSLRAQEKVVKQIIRKVKGHLKNQDLPWAPLDPDTVDRKAWAGLDPRLLIAYKTYLSSIKVWRSGNRKLIFAGVPSGIHTRDYSGKKSRWEVAQIAFVHEMSSGRKIPRRPLWNPSFKELGGAKGIRALFLKSIINHLRVKGIPVKPFQKLL